MRTAIYPGTFDPLTLGHLDVIERASVMFDHVIVTVAINPKKSPLFTVEERMALIRDSTRAMKNVSCESFKGLIVDFVKAKKAHILIRGLRVISDFEYEMQMEHVNRRLDPDIITVFLMPGEKYSYLNSTIVKEVATFGGDISSFVPKGILKKVRQKTKR